MFTAGSAAIIFHPLGSTGADPRVAAVWRELIGSDRDISGERSGSGYIKTGGPFSDDGDEGAVGAERRWPGCCRLDWIFTSCTRTEVLDEASLRRAGARILNELEKVAGFFRSLGEPCRVVLEAGWN